MKDRTPKIRPEQTLNPSTAALGEGSTPETPSVLHAYNDPEMNFTT